MSNFLSKLPLATFILIVGRLKDVIQVNITSYISKGVKDPGNPHYIVKGGYVLVVLVCLSVRQQDCLQSNERVSMQDRDISKRISDQVVQYEVDDVHQNTITMDICKCVTHSIV